jgi:putative chitinase
MKDHFSGGRPGQLTWVKKPYWRDGWFGRGLIQITHKANSDKLGLTKTSALDLKTSVRATFDGMEKGLFTGKKLADYDYLVTRNPDVPGFKYYASRAIVNGDTAGNGAMIASYAKAFEKALRDAGYSQKVAGAGAMSISPARTNFGLGPEATVPAPDPIGTPAIITQGPAQSGGWLSALLAVLLNAFKG